MRFCIFTTHSISSSATTDVPNCICCRATALPGMICVSRKARSATFRNYVAAETATPVIACCACLGADDQKNFYFAGVARSKCVRPIGTLSTPTLTSLVIQSLIPTTTTGRGRRRPADRRVLHARDRRHVHAAQQLGQKCVRGRHVRSLCLPSKDLPFLHQHNSQIYVYVGSSGASTTRRRTHRPRPRAPRAATRGRCAQMFNP